MDINHQCDPIAHRHRYVQVAYTTVTGLGEVLVDPASRLRPIQSTLTWIRSSDLWPSARHRVILADVIDEWRLASVCLGVSRQPFTRCKESAGSARTSRNDQVKAWGADALGALADEAGLTLVQMAVAFAVHHPAVTSTIIGPRTMEHLEGYLAADGIELSDDVLDRIDEIVPPGVTINTADNMWNVGTTSLDAPHSRRQG